MLGKTVRLNALVRPVIMGALPALLLGYSAEAKSPLPRATKVATVSDWYPRLLPQYYWLSDNQILFLRGSDAHNRAFFLRDLSTGKETKLPALTRIFAGTDPGDYLAEASPDGRRLLWWNAHQAFVSTLSASQHSRCRLDSGVQIYWLPDGRHWLELSWGSGSSRPTQVRVHDVTDAAVRTLAIPSGSLLASADGHVYAVAGRPDGRLLVTGWPGQSRSGTLTRQVSILQVSLGKDAVTDGRRSAALMPPDSEIVDMAFSPRADRAAWALRGRDGGLSLWVSRSDGQGMRRIGQVGAPNGQPISFLPIQWSPEERRLSFVLDKTLWAVPVDANG